MNQKTKILIDNHCSMIKNHPVMKFIGTNKWSQLITSLKKQMYIAILYCLLTLYLLWVGRLGK